MQDAASFLPSRDTKFAASLANEWQTALNDCLSPGGLVRAQRQRGILEVGPCRYERLGAHPARLALRPSSRTAS